MIRMKRTWIAALIFLVVGSTAIPLDQDEIEERLKVDVKKTVKKVADILKDHPDLPRLSEEEILDLMNEIASQNLVSNETRDAKQSPLMVVLPYQPRDEDAIRELFTKPPLVEVISDDDSKPEETKDEMKEVLDHFSKNSVPGKYSSQYSEETVDFDSAPKDDDLQEFLKSLDLESRPGDVQASAYGSFKPIPLSQAALDDFAKPGDIQAILSSLDAVAQTQSKRAEKKLNVTDSNELLQNAASNMISAITGENTEKPSDERDITVEPLNQESSTDLETAAADAVSTEEPRNPSLSDLESSFGGQPPVDPSEEVLPPPKKNGFYYFVDWNTFLEVGEDPKKVNIRFEPKLGDRQRFLKVR